MCHNAISFSFFKRICFKLPSEEGGSERRVLTTSTVFYEFYDLIAILDYRRCYNQC